MRIAAMIDSITPNTAENICPTLRAVDWKTPPIVAMEVDDDGDEMDAPTGRHIPVSECE